MSRLSSYILLFGLMIITGSCKKKEMVTTNDCFPNTATTRTILNAEGFIINTNGTFYIVEKNTIDGKLLPCNLASEFKVANLQIRFTGEVKDTRPAGPCCTENFFILKMSK